MRAEPVFEELTRQRAQGEVVYSGKFGDAGAIAPRRHIVFPLSGVPFSFTVGNEALRPRRRELPFP